MLGRPSFIEQNAGAPYWTAYVALQQDERDDGRSAPAVTSSFSLQPPASTTSLTFTNSEPASLHQALGAFV